MTLEWALCGTTINASRMYVLMSLVGNYWQFPNAAVEGKTLCGVYRHRVATSISTEGANSHLNPCEWQKLSDCTRLCIGHAQRCTIRIRSSTVMIVVVAAALGWLVAMYDV